MSNCIVKRFKVSTYVIGVDVYVHTPKSFRIEYDELEANVSFHGITNFTFKYYTKAFTLAPRFMQPDPSACVHECEDSDCVENVTFPDTGNVLDHIAYTKNHTKIYKFLK
ncbi:hypothetical protein BLOT_009009, partial [Blomia tropicalis]